MENKFFGKNAGESGWGSARNILAAFPPRRVPPVVAGRNSISAFRFQKSCSTLGGMDNLSQRNTALITGASSGIGETFARHLARRGYHLILVARREELLQRLAEELRHTYKVSVEVFPADLAQDAGVARVEERLRTCPHLTLLINNAGFGAGGLYHQADPAKQFAMIQVHVLATARLVRAVLPSMVERRQGAIINVASVAAFAAMPTSVMYGSTKAWMLAFSRALAAETEASGVRIQALCPGMTHTGFHSTAEYENFDHSAIPAFLWMSSEEVVAASLAALERNKVVVIPGWVNKVLVAALRSGIFGQFARRFGRKRWRQAREPQGTN